MPWGNIVFGVFYETIAAGIQFAPRVFSALGAVGWTLVSVAVFSGSLVVQGLFQGRGRKYKFRRNNKLYRL